MGTTTQTVPLNGIWTSREGAVRTSPGATAPSDAEALARHVRNSQGLENHGSRPVGEIAEDITRMQGGTPPGDHLTGLKYPPENP